MRPRVYSLFWIGYCAGLLSLSAAWRDRDVTEPESSDEQISMAAWLSLPERQRVAMVQQYVPNRKPPIKYIDNAERKRQEALQAA